MKNDILIGLMGFILSAMVAWISSLTIMVFDLDKALAVEQLKGQHTEELIERNHQD